MKKYLLTICFFACVYSAKAQIIYAKESADTTIHTKVEQSAEPPGGHNAFDKYVKLKMIKPQSLKDPKIKGAVVIAFIVEKNGTLANIHVDKGLTPDADAEALRSVKAGNRWMPAQNGEFRVRQYSTLTIKF